MGFKSHELKEMDEKLFMKHFPKMKMWKHEEERSDEPQKP